VTGSAFVSTGALPARELVQALVTAVFERHRGNRAGDVSHVYPALAAADPDGFGVCVLSVSGDVFGAGDVDVEFTIMSVAKPFRLCPRLPAARL
jgi:glutaminase